MTVVVRVVFGVFAEPYRLFYNEQWIDMMYIPTFRVGKIHATGFVTSTKQANGWFVASRLLL